MAEVRRGPRGRHVPPDGGSGAVDFRRWIVQELVTEAVLAHEIRSAGIEGSETEAVASLVERITETVRVAEADVRAYYERNRDLYRRREARRVRHVLVPGEASAQGIAGQLRAGDDVDDLATDLVDVHRGEISGPFEEAVFDAVVGCVVGPIRTEHGWHVVRIEAATPESQVPFEEARPAIEAELLAAARTHAFAAWLERRRVAIAVIEPRFEHPAHPVHGMPSHRH